VYHVQSEARERELLLQTQVFSSGRCVAKRAVPYNELHARPDFQPEQMHERLRAQHKEVIEHVRAGQLDKIGPQTVSAKVDPPPPPAGTPAEAAKPELSIEWTNAAALNGAASTAQLQFAIRAGAAPAANARVTVRLNGSAGPAVFAQAQTDSAGCAVISLALDNHSGADAVALLVQANHDGASATRKYQLRRNS
jgi:hypothetical protein